MRSWLSVLVFGMGLSACAEKPSGHAHWSAACAHAGELYKAAGEAWTAQGCVESFSAFPLEVADDVARCMRQQTSVPTEPAPDKGCWRAETRTYFKRVDEATEAAGKLHQAVQTYMDANSRLPSSLSKAIGHAEPLDPWGRPFRLRPVTETDTETDFEVRSAGPDGTFDTDDDVIAAPDFIYFQF